jgi:CubicO group peptidase (beta-lactamase class C family)
MNAWLPINGEGPMRYLAIAASIVLALALWTGLVMMATLEGWGRTALAPRDDTAAFMDAASTYIDANSRGNIALTLIEDGRVYAERFSSVGKPVDKDTLFQVASLSKWVTAWGVMTLVESGRIDLDAPASRYLTRWTLPQSQFDTAGVTVRRLLSHTAGLTDGLGYAGFAPGAELQTLEQSLTRAADASPGAEGALRVGAAPGSEWIYSGGGYTLLQLIIEETSGEPFNTYMQRAVFQPLGMVLTTFELPEGGGTNLAEFFDKTGAPATHFQFTAKAAASLYTSAADLTRFIQAQLTGPDAEPPGRGVLRPETLVEMRRPHAAQYGADIWGLGVILYAPNNSGAFIIGHDGSNPAINTAARFDPVTGDGIIALETGNDLLATEIGGHWVFWKTGNVDLLDVTAQLPRALLILAAGGVIIAILGVAAAWRYRRS